MVNSSKYITEYISLIPHYINPSLPFPFFVPQLIALLIFYCMQSSKMTFVIQIMAYLF